MIRDDGRLYEGRVTLLSPLEVRLNGDTTSAPARAMSDFAGATADPNTGTEVMVAVSGGRRFAWRVL